MFDPAARDAAPADIASLAVWFDAFTLNVDRTPRNANLLVWHRKLYCIDHGAALFFHHSWATRAQKIESACREIEPHVLLPGATQIEQAAALARTRLTQPVLEEIVGQVPEAWFAPIGEDPNVARAGYVDFFRARLATADIFEQEAIRAHARVV